MSFWVPRGVPPGTHTVRLVGRDPDGEPNVVAIPVQVAGPSRIPWLPLALVLIVGVLFAGLSLLWFGGSSTRSLPPRADTRKDQE